MATASKIRKQIEDTFGKMSGANDELAKLLEDEKRSELESEVSNSDGFKHEPDPNPIVFSNPCVQKT